MVRIDLLFVLSEQLIWILPNESPKLLIPSPRRWRLMVEHPQCLHEHYGGLVVNFDEMIRFGVSLELAIVIFIGVLTVSAFG